MPGVLQHVKRSRNQFAGSLIALIIGFGIVIAPAASAISVGGPSDCNDNNAIINCGAHSTGALLNAYQSSAYVRGVYAYFGISQSDIANLPVTNVAGHVNKDGKVYVDNHSDPVATSAMTAGQAALPGSNKVTSQGATFYVRPPSVSFQQTSLPAFVAMKNGQFQFAIIASCGNPVKAAAVGAQNGIGQAQAVSKPPAKPAAKPAPPAPTQTQSQSQSQSVDVTNNNTNTSNSTVNNTQATTTITKPQQEQPATTETTSQPAPVETSSQPSQPTSLVNTGTSGVVGIFLFASIAGAFVFRHLLIRRFSA